MLLKCSKETAESLEKGRRHKFNKNENIMGLILKQTLEEEKYLEVKMPYGPLQSDLPFLQAFNKTQKSANHHLDLSLYPEPFAGNPKAKVYLLSGNPGWSDSDNRLMTTNHPDWDKMMQHSYNPIPGLGHPQTMYWLDPYWKGLIKPVSGYHGGFTWWEKRTKQLSHIPNLEEKLFNIDYHSYHSKNIKINTNIHNLPSQVEVNNILKNAFKNKNRLFIIVRCRKAWEKRLKAILNVQQLPNNVIYLDNPRCAYLTPGNMKKNDGWKRLLNAL